MRAAAHALRYGPLPRECRTATPIPYGRPPATAEMMADARDVVRLGSALAAIAGSDLTELQRDLVWGRALGLSWKELMMRNPGLSLATLKRHHADAVDEIAMVLKRKEKR